MKRPSVLIADDHEKSRILIVGSLDKVFHVVEAVANGEELVEAAMRLRPDVIVSDIFMPRLDGPAARARLIAEGHTIPFVFVSALGKEVLYIAENTSAVAFVFKGDVAFHLVNAVEAVLTGRSYISPYYRE